MSAPTSDAHYQIAIELLVLSREAVVGMTRARTGGARGLIASSFENKARPVLDRLRGSAITPDQFFNQLIDQTLETIASLSAWFPVNTDAGGFTRLLAIELLVIGGRLDQAVERIIPLTKTVRAIPSLRLRDEVMVRSIDLLSATQTRQKAVQNFLIFVSHQLRLEDFSGKYGASVTKLLRDPGKSGFGSLPLARHVLRLWQWLHQRRGAEAADRFMSGLGLKLICREADRVVLRGCKVKVIRSMGGLGDLICMTPGLKALAVRFGQPVPFAVPRRYMSLFQGNPFVEAHPIEELDHDWYDDAVIHDLTDCPAGFVESKTAPFITANRIELFAAGMGVDRRELDRVGRTPVYQPTAEARAAATQWLAERGLEPNGFIAIQAASADPYKDWPRMPQAAATLAQTMKIVVLHDQPIAAFTVLAASDQNIRLAFGLDATLSLAILCLARVIIAPDSGLAHIAGAMGLPCVNIFGPTNGELTTKDYPKTFAITRRHDMPCSPCRRNQVIPCELSRSSSSTCLDTLEEGVVISAVQRILAEH